ncbi:ARMT1-like domain-containing protein [Desulfosporosinus sp. PR]|uniref:damage-control phosphatase ARMT1 family protein n=1 Tax=Candidatus Desulfosporosinus nitrosoreducens TaxID=3401928 RepID=UPI0027F96B7A|nr:ARMT1-like domain-containing protein [Desulfosporosinus sp. PR]MDQ7093212.1 ARMT1-like domain-containing protein [Desulfosporosinus sp. PR]
MKVALDCIPCYIKQAINTLAQAGISEDKAREIIHETLPLLPRLDPQGTPAENSTVILRKVNELLGIEDPFERAKKESNQLALELLPQLEEKIRQSPDSLLMSLKISVAGNIIDMGILKEFDVEGSIQEAMVKKFARDDYVSFKQDLKEAREILILGDNSGEIAFDSLLAKQLSQLGLEVTYAVKDRAILNDATLEDAVHVGLTGQIRVISNGSGFLGTILKDCSQEFQQVYTRADLIISKGQANYESLEAQGKEDRRLYFLLRAKCEIVAKSLEVQLGEMVFCRS